MTERTPRKRGFHRLLAGISVLGITAALGASASLADEVRVLNWKGWGTDEPWAVEAFEKETGTKVVHDYITSFPEVFTKLRTNPGYYDVVVLNAAFIGQAAQEGLIQPIDTSKIPNFAELYPDMRDAPQLSFDGKVWGVAWVWGGTSVSYNTEVFSDPPTSLEVLWDPKYADRVCWRDDPEDSVRFAALALGQNPDDPEDMDAIAEKLKALKPQIKAFWKSGDEWLKLVAANECDLSTIWTNNTEAAAVKDGLPVSFIVAEEGAIAFRDGMSIAADPPNEAGANAFINYMISKDFYAGWVDIGGAPVSANEKAIGDLPESSLTREILTQPDALKRLNFKGPLTDEQRQTYLDLWQETKAYFAQ
ncbi:ABC transporter substrate-binding protein [Microbaculum marinum]|uniref:Extracellular solute-binding protein n=1 Tax=Microbaculum marinum TaxID=1764581 RepID=A0AAW9RMK0_9HYPH